MYASSILRPTGSQPPPCYEIPTKTVSGKSTSLVETVNGTDQWCRKKIKEQDNQADYSEHSKRLETWRLSVCEPIVKHKSYNKMSEETRKERNRRLAKEFRAKKKLELELYQRWVAFLQQRVNELQLENWKLRQLVSDTSVCSKEGNQESSIGEKSKDDRNIITKDLEMRPMAYHDSTLFSDTALTTSHTSRNLSRLFPIFDNSQSLTEEGYPLSPVSEQVSPCRVKRKESILNAVDREELLTTSESSVLGIPSLVHF
ncbi:hypothetical protein GpartN1_g4408.t1 [Galdieria partita]|uniref:BZIP domain-containing protein n=1 Tax=Galdieria partita TaxID=83374 RepID=A0A9C7PZ95_9RHOD|nr:hypothetical protein GpartN1_g4408.t1 [Galdieria partita]